MPQFLPHLTLPVAGPLFAAGLASLAALGVPIALLACSASDGDVSTSPAKQETVPPPATDDPRRPIAAVETPPQLAQYPGAPFEDKKGNLWFGTVGEGLIRHDGKDFTTFTTKDGLAGNTIRGIIEDAGGALWIGTSGGVSKYDGEAFTTLTDYGDTPVTYTFGNQADHLDLWDVMRDSKGTLWIATLDGVFRHDGTRFIPFPLPAIGSAQASEFSPKMVYSIYEDSEGAHWFGTDGAGAIRYDGTDMTVFTVEEHGLCSNRVATVMQDSRGDFWFGTSDGGVSHYDGKKFTTHLRVKERSIHSGWGRYFAILEDKDGDIWFGCAYKGGGVYRYDGETFRYLSEAAGLGTGGVPSIKQDRAGRLWFGTTSGVFLWDGERFVSYSKSK